MRESVPTLMGQLRKRYTKNESIFQLYLHQQHNIGKIGTYYEACQGFQEAETILKLT